MKLKFSEKVTHYALPRQHKLHLPKTINVFLKTLET